MKKSSKLFFFAAILGAISTLLVILYLKKDKLKNCPFCQKFMDQEYDPELDFEEEEEILPEEEPEEAVPVKENKQKVRRGYIPLKLHEAN